MVLKGLGNTAIHNNQGVKFHETQRDFLLNKHIYDCMQVIVLCLVGRECKESVSKIYLLYIGSVAKRRAEPSLNKIWGFMKSKNIL